MPTAAAPMATAWWSLAGARCWTSCLPARASQWGRSTWRARPACGANSRPLNIASSGALSPEGHPMSEGHLMSATSDNLALARRTILAPGGLDDARLDRTLGLVMDHAVDAADLYFQVSREESWALEDGIVKEGSASIEEGVGVRAISGEKTGVAYSDEIQMDALEEASRAARAIAKQTPGKGMQAWQRAVSSPLLYQPVDPLLSLDDAVKVDWLMRVDRETRAMDPRVKQVNASCH